MSWLLFGTFVVLMCAAVPLAVALGLSGVAVIVAAKMGIMSVPNTVYGGIAKYPLIAIPVFILAGMIFAELKEQYELGNVLAVLIDEAQNLDFGTLEERRELGNLETGKDKLLQIVLVGQSEREGRLEKPQLCELKQRVALRGRLRPIATAEVGPYINTRLRAAGQFTDRVFDHDAIQRIAQYSGGIPRVINIICDNALLTAYALSAREVRASMIDEIAGDLRLRLRFDDQILLNNNSIFLILFLFH